MNDQFVRADAGRFVFRLRKEGDGKEASGQLEESAT